jgi:hypothetical protein
MKKMQKPEAAAETAGLTLPAPQGIGMAVAVDWGLAVQILFTPIINVVFGKSNSIKIPGLDPLFGTILFFLIACVAACIPAFFGEMVRRGRNWTRWIQIGANALLSLVGIVSLVNLYQSISRGNFWPMVTEVILVIISPLIVWRLSRPATAQWFRHVTVAEASRRHGGKWIWFIALWALVGGLLQIFVAMN